MTKYPKPDASRVGTDEEYSFRLFFTHGQLAVFWPGLGEPFPDWNSIEFAQGFARKEGSVSFAMPDESGAISVHVVICDRQEDVSYADARRVDVPFDVPAGKGVEIASISESRLLQVPPGSYVLRCETASAKRTGRAVARFMFIHNPATPTQKRASP